MTTARFGLHTIDYSVQGWDSILAADMEILDTVIPSRELVTLGETVTAYQPACFAAADSKWYKAKADGTLQPAHGLFLEGGDEDDDVHIFRMGLITNAGWAWASLGAPIYLNPSTAGAMTQTPPGANRQIIGYAISATSMLVVPTPSEIPLTRSVQIVVFDFTTNVATGDGKAYFVVPDELTGMNLVRIAATVITAGVTNSTTIGIRNVTDAQEMLSADMAIETTETSTRTSATPGTIDTAHDDVATGDVLAIDVDAVSTTAPKGLIVELVFELP